MSPTHAIETLFAIWLFATGVCVGSFLNVVIARVPEDLSIVRPGSRCPRCGHVLRWYENIPLVSWILLRARCSSCRLPISIRYPLVELVTGLLYVACLSVFGWTWELASALLLVSFLLPLTFIDAEHWILPFSITIPGLVVGLVLAIPMGLPRFQDALLGAAIGFLSFRALEWIGWKLFAKEALGGGDKFLIALIGAFLTWRALLLVVFLSSFQGALFGLARLLLTGRAGPPLPPAGNEVATEPTGATPATTSPGEPAPGASAPGPLVPVPERSTSPLPAEPAPVAPPRSL